MTNFNTILSQIIKIKNSNVCVGLDLDPRRVPIPNLLEFNRSIIDSTHDLVAAYKPNLAFYEALGLPGLKILRDTIDHVKQNAPDTLIIGDAKRGDIGPSAAAYATALLDVWRFDAITVNPWGGSETIEPYTKDPSKGVFIWAKGSNPGSKDLQDLQIEDGDRTLYEKVVGMGLELNVHSNVGFVVGATFPEEMNSIRQKALNVPFLIPGVGAQGGDLEAAVLPHVESTSPFIINSSRGILYAGDNADNFREAARLATSTLKSQINDVIRSHS